MAASHAIKEALWLGTLLGELGVRIKFVKLYCDNQGCIANLKHHLISKHTKHISVRLHHGREKVAWGQIVPDYVATDENMADMFTKPLSATVFQKHREKLGMR